ncbi:MAG TPA: histidine kinase [Gemmatimonadaceae bacterium]|nr:histidine kinase [Gemmatimonadaceae bacterium]
MRRKGSRARAWALYFAAWIPIAAIYANLISGGKPLRASEAFNIGVDYALIPSLLGIVVWWMTGRLRWPTTRPVLFFALQFVFAVAYSVVWLVLIVGTIAVFTGLSAALTIARTFVGWQLVSGFWSYGITAGVAYAIRVTRALREREAATARAEAARAGAELSALRAQLDPHFLFNTLHTLTALVRRDPRSAEEALERFGEMLRYVLDVNRAAREDVTVGEEMEFVRNFLALENLRLGTRLRCVERLDPDSLNCIIPSLTLQPLVENAVKYAVASRVEGGSVTISSSLEDSSLVLEVSDDGPGNDGSWQNGMGVGLRAVRQRLMTRFAGNGTFGITTSPGEGFSVRLSLPA